MFEESAMRSVFKAISWRVLAILTTTLLVYLNSLPKGFPAAFPSTLFPC